MAVNIVSAFESIPPTIAIRQPAVLRVTLRSDAPPEMATLTFTVVDPAYRFFPMMTSMLINQVMVGAADLTVDTPYALDGPAGPAMVQIDLSVVPNAPPSMSATIVVIT